MIKLLTAILLISSTNLFASVRNVESGSLIEATSYKNHTFQIGDVKQSLLSLEKFQQYHGNCWRLMNGSSIVDTDLANETGWTIIPDALSEGTFLRQAKEGREIGSYEADEIKSHIHSYETSRSLDGGGNQSAYIGYGQNSSRSDRSGKIYESGGDESRPKNHAVNFFMKVNRVCN